MLADVSSDSPSSDEGLSLETSANIHTFGSSPPFRLSATYSDVDVDRDTLGCFLLIQLIAPRYNINTLPEVDFRSSVSKGQSASEYPYTLVSLA